MGAEMGPLTAAQLLEMAQSHQLTPEDLVRRGADGEWVAGYRVKGLFDERARSRTVAASPPPAAPKAPETEPESARTGEAKGASTETQWFYISQGTKYGPLTFAVLQERSRSGQIRATDRVWSSSTPKWSEARRIEGLHFRAP